MDLAALTALAGRAADLSGTDIEAIVAGETWRFLLAFCRIGSAIMMLPGFGDHAFPPKTRLLFALVLSAALGGMTPGLPTRVPAETSEVVSAVAAETAAGLYLGSVARVLAASLHFAGHCAATMSGLANVMSPATGAFEGGTMVSNALVAAGTAVVFFGDVHHLAVEGLLASYRVIPPGALPDAADFARQGVAAVAESFAMGFRFAAPFLIMGFVTNVGLGLANRMMPVLPVFAVATPVLVAGGLAALALAVGGILTSFADRIGEWFVMSVI